MEIFHFLCTPSWSICDIFEVLFHFLIIACFIPTQALILKFNIFWTARKCDFSITWELMINLILGPCPSGVYIRQTTLTYVTNV